MKKLSVLVSLMAASLLTACGEKQTNAEVVAEAPAINQELAAYKAGAKELVAMIKAEKPDADIVQKSAALVAN